MLSTSTIVYAQNLNNLSEPVKQKNFIGLGIEQSLNTNEETLSKTIAESKEKRKRFWNIYTGHKLSENISVKAEYLKLVDINYSNTQIKVRAISLSALGFYPINNKLSVFGEAGLYTYRLSQKINNGNETINNNHTNTKPYIGTGLKYDLGKNTDLILKYANYGKIKNADYKGNISQVGLSMEYKF